MYPVLRDSRELRTLYLHLSGTFDVVGYMAANGPAPTIISQLPFGKVVVGVFTLLAIIFLATTFDSSSYILASVTQKHVEDEPIVWNRLFWAFALAIMPLTLMFLGGLDTLQTASIVGGFPLIFIMFLLAWSFVRVSSRDIRASDDYESPTIHIKYRKRKKSPFDALKEKPHD